MPNTALISADCPMVKKWWTQTVKLSTAIAMVAMTSEVYPYRSLPEKVDTTSE